MYSKNFLIRQNQRSLHKHQFSIHANVGVGLDVGVDVGVIMTDNTSTFPIVVDRIRQLLFDYGLSEYIDDDRLNSVTGKCSGDLKRAFFSTMAAIEYDVRQKKLPNASNIVTIVRSLRYRVSMNWVRLIPSVDEVGVGIESAVKSVQSK